MQDPLVQIVRLIQAGSYEFTEHALERMAEDNLDEDEAKCLQRSRADLYSKSSVTEQAIRSGFIAFWAIRIQGGQFISRVKSWKEHSEYGVSSQPRRIWDEHKRTRRAILLSTNTGPA